MLLVSMYKPETKITASILYISATDQETFPVELPVIGDPRNETILELTSTGKQALFKLDGKKLRLIRPLDRDPDNLSHVTFQVSIVSCFYFI